jgi:hypothetical protein
MFQIHLRDRPFNLQGGVGVWFFVSFRIFFRMTLDLEYLFILSREFFFQNSTLGYMSKTLNQISFFPPQKSEYCFQPHWESEYFFRKKNHNPPFKLNGRSLKEMRPCIHCLSGGSTEGNYR